MARKKSCGTYAGSPRSPTYDSRVDFGKPVITALLHGKSVLVTGGATGIGAGIVTALAEAGAYVTIADNAGDEGQRFMLELVNRNLHVQYVYTDVKSFKSQTEAFKLANSFHNGLDIVIPCAGSGSGNSIPEWLSATPADADFPTPIEPPSTALLDTTATATYYTTHLAMHYFRRVRLATSPTAGMPFRTSAGDNHSPTSTYSHAHTNSTSTTQTNAAAAHAATHAAACARQIIFVGSLAAYFTQPLNPAAQASAFAMRGLWKSMRASPALVGARTNFVAPTYVRSGKSAAGALETELTSMGVKMVDVGDVVDAVMRIACDDGIVGRAIAVVAEGNFDICDDPEGFDGGREIRRRVQDGPLFGLALLE
ncbi:NAD(P)-binding protein [Saccharata proteae CBS 121410]|uniref:NAD(P)-binding protein n=1 Tax=Saccharata proteae CBS 121410 TaxID=1314787 RepID=A0A9P4HXJ5_9PEZI|nr:NAD(P)-binding protein [Saccharata proteae CBS 121410]